MSNVNNQIEGVLPCGQGCQFLTWTGKTSHLNPLISSVQVDILNPVIKRVGDWAALARTRTDILVYLHSHVQIWSTSGLGLGWAHTFCLPRSSLLGSDPTQPNPTHHHASHHPIWAWLTTKHINWGWKWRNITRFWLIQNASLLYNIIGRVLVFY